MASSSVLLRSEKSEIDFHSVHSCLYGAFFLLRMPVKVQGRPATIRVSRKPVLLIHYPDGHEEPVDLSFLRKNVEEVLFTYGVYLIQKAFFENVPSFSVDFGSQARLKFFLTHANSEAVTRIEQRLNELCQIQASPAEAERCIKVCLELYLMNPQSENVTFRCQIVDLGNYETRYREFEESKTFEFQSCVFEDCRTGKLQYRVLMSTLRFKDEGGALASL